MSRTPQGVRGLKQFSLGLDLLDVGSHSARSAWIETLRTIRQDKALRSHSARSAWIETFSLLRYYKIYSVALRKECVD